MKDKYLRISHAFLNDAEVGNLFDRVGTTGFTLYSYFIYRQGNSSSCEISIKMIQEFFNRDYDNRPKIRYRGKKECSIELIKDKKTINKYLKALEINNLINIYNPKDNYKINDIIIIQCNRLEDTYFEAIACDLFLDYIHKIGHVEWALLCILGKLHNPDFGGVTCEGFANPSEAYLQRIIKKDIETIRAYLYLLQKQRLIKIEQQQPVYKCNDVNGEAVYEFEANHYFIKYKSSNNEYFVKLNNEE